MQVIVGLKSQAESGPIRGRVKFVWHFVDGGQEVRGILSRMYGGFELEGRRKLLVIFVLPGDFGLL